MVTYLGQEDYNSLEYLQALHEGIVDAYVGIVTGLKSTEKSESLLVTLNLPTERTVGGLLLEHTPAMLKLVRQVYEEEGTDLTLKTGAGLIGDLAETFPTGQLKELLLNDWVVAMLKTKTRNADLKKTLRWAREVSFALLAFLGCSPVFDSSSSVQLRKRTATDSTTTHNDSLFLDCPSTVLGSILVGHDSSQG